MTNAAATGWREASLAGAYLRSREELIPMLDVMEDLVRRLLERLSRPVERFLDLGCGAGAMSAVVRSVFPAAEAVLIDFSEHMLEQARRAGEGPGWQVLRGDLADAGWLRELPPGRYDAVVSGLAIHHLPGERKRALFGEVHGLLEPGGLFVDLDYVTQPGPLAGLWDEAMVAAAVRAERARGGRRSEREVEEDMFDDSGEDRPDTAEQQVAWLREAGFEPADVYFKWAEAAVFGGLRPDGA